MKITYQEFKERQNWNLYQKIDHAVGTMERFLSETNGRAFISFSGGKDSTVLLDIARRFIDRKFLGVFSNTGNEYPETVKFVRSFDNLTIIHPQMRVKEVLAKYGFPLISKEQSQYIRQARNTKSEKLRMLAFALRADGWFLRQDIIWAKPNPMPESMKDRCTKSHEYIFLLTKSPKYYFDCEAIHEKAVTSGTIPTNAPRYGGNKYTATPEKFYRTKSGNAYIDREFRNKRDVWTIPTQPLQEAHFATFPEKLVADCILAGCPENGIVLDPFMGSGTTGIVARKFNRKYIGFELNPEYIEIANKRLKKELGLFI